MAVLVAVVYKIQAAPENLLLTADRAATITELLVTLVGVLAVLAKCAILLLVPVVVVVIVVQVLMQTLVRVTKAAAVGAVLFTVLPWAQYLRQMVHGLQEPHHTASTQDQ
jgi:hypothetical protein